ncbi:hypothetical protein [Chamaesiphon sp.]
MNNLSPAEFRKHCPPTNYRSNSINVGLLFGLNTFLKLKPTRSH